MALEDERELVKAVKKKNSNVIKDLQKQLQSSNRYWQGSMQEFLVVHSEACM